MRRLRRTCFHEAYPCPAGPHRGGLRKPAQRAHRHLEPVPEVGERRGAARRQGGDPAQGRTPRLASCGYRLSVTWLR